MINLQSKRRSPTHGGAVYRLVHDPFDVNELREYVCADVLDAWFDPAPGVLAVLEDQTAWQAKSAPPAYASALARRLASAFGIAEDTVVLGAGSSDLIYRYFTNHLGSQTRVFVLDPTYSEYRHVCESVIGCRMDASLSLGDVGTEHDVVVIVNPNNPSGELFSRGQIEGVLGRMRSDAVLWIDEAYMPFVEGGDSMHGHSDPRVVVCQSLSKCFALSGLRTAFLSGSAEFVERMKRLTPPWNMSLPAILATDAALIDLGYYSAKYEETRALRWELAEAIRSLGIGSVEEGAANWLVLRTPGAQNLIDHCLKHKVLLRNGEGMFANPPSDFVRIAVRGREENARIIQALSGA